MLDYYFCQECQTYHQPNRIINGEILSACQCQISTQSGVSTKQDLNNFDTIAKLKNKNYMHRQIVAEKIQPTPSIHIQSPTISPRTRQSTSPAFTSRHEGTQINNLPFLAIANDQNKHQMKKIIIQKSPIRQQQQRIRSPVKINGKQVVINRSISPLTKSLPYPVETTYPIYRIVKKQQLQPTKISRKTPIQTINNLIYNIPCQSQPKTSISSNKLIIDSTNKIPDDKNNLHKVYLDRVSGQSYGDDQVRVTLDRVIENRNQIAFSLDRVTQQKDVIAQREEKDQCCGKLCYF